MMDFEVLYYCYYSVYTQVSKGKNVHAFYSMPEFEEWKSNTDNWQTWKIKYYKGVVF